MDSRELSTKARALGGALEPIIGQVYFSPECHANYVALGFQPSPGDMNGVALPEGVAYFTSRGSLMGQVSGEVVAAAFAVFNPLVVVPAVTAGWQITFWPILICIFDTSLLLNLKLTGSSHNSCAYELNFKKVINNKTAKK